MEIKTGIDVVTREQVNEIMYETPKVTLINQWLQVISYTQNLIDFCISPMFMMLLDSLLDVYLFVLCHRVCVLPWSHK